MVVAPMPSDIAPPAKPGAQILRKAGESGTPGGRGVIM
jgi:hypothetical protein